MCLFLDGMIMYQRMMGLMENIKKLAVRIAKWSKEEEQKLKLMVGVAGNTSDLELTYAQTDQQAQNESR